MALVRLRRIPPSFPPDKWNVHNATLTHGDRTNNACESWNSGFRQLVGHYHPGVWTAIESLQLDMTMFVTSLMQHTRSQLPSKLVRRTMMQLQKRLAKLCCRYRDGNIAMDAFLAALDIQFDKLRHRPTDVIGIQMTVSV